MKVLVIAEHDNASLHAASYHIVTAASELFLLGAGEVHLLVAGQYAPDVAIAATKISGVARVIYAQGESLAHGSVKNIAAQVLALPGSYCHILFPATTWGESIAKIVATRLDVAPVSNVIGIVSIDRYEQLINEGNAIATAQRHEAVKVLTVRASGFDAAGQGGTAAIEGAHAVTDSNVSDLIKNKHPDQSSPKIIYPSKSSPRCRTQCNLKFSSAT